MKYIRLSIIFLLALVLFPGISEARENKTEHIPDLFGALHFPSDLTFCGERVPLEIREVREELEKAMLLSLWNRGQIVLWLKRCGRIMPVVELHLQKRGLPHDLKYVPVIESSLLAHAGSHKGAVGYWQFIASTGQRYGLRIDSFIDERRNLELSTQAGLTYLQDLYQQFGSWALALAAYNMGENGLEDRMKKQQQTSYYDLYLPAETMSYVYKAIAVKLLLSNPERYGFDPEPEDIYQPVERHKVAVQVPTIFPLQLLVDNAGISLKRFKEYNPEILGNTLPKGRHVLAFPQPLPKDFRKKIEKAIKVYKAEVRSSAPRWHTVRKGETLYGIAARHNIPASSLIRWNKLKKKDIIHPGMRLKLQP